MSHWWGEFNLEFFADFKSELIFWSGILSWSDTKFVREVFWNCLETSDLSSPRIPPLPPGIETSHGGLKKLLT